MPKFIFYSIICIILLGLAAYGNSLNGEFIWDDEHLVSNNAFIRSWANIGSIFTADIGAGGGREYNFYRPLQIVTYIADFSLWRLESPGYHLTSVLLHIMTALAIYWLVNILYDDRILSFFTAILFTVHPVHTEAVSYISGRADPLALLFMLGSFIFYVRHNRSGRPFFLIFALIAYISALLSKENSLILPLLLLLYHCALREKIKAKSFAPILAVTLIYAALRMTALNSILPDLSVRPSLAQRIPSVFAAIAGYSKVLLLPVGLHMEYGGEPFGFSDPRVIAGICITVFLLFILVMQRKSNGLAFFSISWFFIAFLPISNIFYPLNVYMAEHWLYLPSIGFFLIIAYLLSRLYRTGKFRILSVIIISALLIFYSFATFSQGAYWKNPVTFFERTLKYGPNNLKIYGNLADAYKAAGNYEKAMNLYREAIEADPGHAGIYNDLGLLYGDMARYEEAIACYAKAVEIEPNFSKAYNNLGNVYNAMGEKEDAVRSYEKAVEVDPNCAMALHNLGNACRRNKEYKEAINFYKKALQANPYNPITHNNLAVVYFYEGRYDLAIQHCDRAIELGCQVPPDFLKALKPYR